MTTTTEPLRVYVAGPMRGRPAFNFPAFAAATSRLRSLGYEVHSPAEYDLEHGFDPTGLTGDENLDELGFNLRSALGADLEWITSKADALYLLDGWQKSSGARAELATAAALGMLAADEVPDPLTPAWQPAAEVLGSRPPLAVGGFVSAGTQPLIAASLTRTEADHRRYGLAEVDTPTRQQVLAEASALVVGDRQADYGPPAVNFQRIADIWGALFPERCWSPADVALGMAGVKLARAAQGYKRDTAVDLAGYAGLYAELSEDDEPPAPRVLRGIVIAGAGETVR